MQPVQHADRSTQGCSTLGRPGFFNQMWIRCFNGLHAAAMLEYRTTSSDCHSLAP